MKKILIVYDNLARRIGGAGKRIWSSPWMWTRFWVPVLLK
jgi:hypothetical protein